MQTIPNERGKHCENYNPRLFRRRQINAGRSARPAVRPAGAAPGPGALCPGLGRTPQPAQQADVAAFLDANSETGWVIDGNYTNLCYDRRLAESDRILILAFGRWACLRRVMERTRRYRGKTRPDMREGCTEKLDAEFVRWVLWDGRTKERRARFTAVTAAWPAKAEVLRSQRDLDRLYRAENLDPPQ